MAARRLVSVGNAALDIYIGPALQGSSGRRNGHFAGSVEIFPGGCAVNVARACAIAGVDSSLWGPVAADPFGRILKDSASANTLGRLEVRLAPPDMDPAAAPSLDGAPRTGSVIILNDGADFQTYNGANGLYTGRDLAKISLEGAGAVCLAGLAFLPSLTTQAISLFADRAARSHVPFFIAPGPVCGEGFAELEQNCNVSGLFVNRSEALRLSHAAGFADPAAWGSQLAGRNSILVITDGADGGEFWCPGLHTRYQAIPIESADTIGAGDTFCGTFLAGAIESGFLAEIHAGKQGDRRMVDEILKTAATAAAATCKSRGGSPTEA